MGETQGQTLRLNVFIRSLRTGAEGAGQFRHETELEVALYLDRWEDHGGDTLIQEVFRWKPVKTFDPGYGNKSQADAFKWDLRKCHF